VLQSPASFAANEFFGVKGRVVAHQLVGGGTAVVRHRTRDVDMFDEILVEPKEYALPLEAETRIKDITPLRILDLGGNVGLFGLDLLRRWPSAHVTSVEADPENLPVLRACAARNPQARWRIVAAAASASAGTLMFEAGNFADSAVSEHGTVAVPSIDAFELLADADVVKIDIEGSEWAILLDERFESLAAPVLVMEWHAHQAPQGRDLHSLVVERFEQAGYQTCGGACGDHGTVWGWK
jgi:FkbM family methyltransferase